MSERRTLPITELVGLLRDQAAERITENPDAALTLLDAANILIADWVKLNKPTFNNRRNYSFIDNERRVELP
jgi:hypothetical protein